MPGATRPQRPARWFADACDTGSIGQALHLESPAVARDAGGAGVDDVADARHRERRLGDVGGEHDPAAGPAHRCALEDLVLLGRRQPRVERQHLGAAQVEPAERVGGVVDLALARQEHEHVAGPLVRELLDRVDDPLDLIAVRFVGLVVDQRPVPQLDRKGPPGHLDHRRRHAVSWRSARRSARCRWWRW